MRALSKCSALVYCGFVIDSLTVRSQEYAPDVACRRSRKLSTVKKHGVRASRLDLVEVLLLENGQAAMTFPGGMPRRADSIGGAGDADFLRPG